MLKCVKKTLVQVYKFNKVQMAYHHSARLGSPNFI